jgi:hypothetical protein
MYVSSAPEFTGLAEHWNGASWSQQELPAPESGGGNDLSAVSCVASATSCTAVGLKYGANHIKATLAEHWNGTEWSVEATPTPGTPGVGSLTVLEGVSCPSTVVCVAFGRSPSGLLAEVDPPEEIAQKIREAENRRHEAAEQKIHEEEAATKKKHEEEIAAAKDAVAQAAVTPPGNQGETTTTESTTSGTTTTTTTSTATVTPLLSTPIATPLSTSGANGATLTNAQKPAKVLKTCEIKPGKKRASCQKRARQKHRAAKAKNAGNNKGRV